MSARAIWKAVIRCGEFRLPVKLYSAVQDRGVRFHLLHDQDSVRVKQRLVNSATGKTVEYKEARRGYEVERGVFVLVGDEELKSLEPEESREIDVVCFLEPHVINHQWYDRPYYLGPDGDDGQYLAFLAALQQKGREGVAHWVMRRKEYVGALRAEENCLALITLRHAGEVIPGSELEAPAGRAFQKQEAAMAEQLLKALDDEFRPSDYRDEHRVRVMELIEAKREGREFEFEEPEEERHEGESLAEVLQASLAAARGR